MLHTFTYKLVDAKALSIDNNVVNATALKR